MKLEPVTIINCMVAIIEGLVGGYGKKPKTQVAVYRPTNLTDEEIQVIVRASRSYVGRRSGYKKIVAHFFDWLLQGAYVFRRLAFMDNYPICSWVVAHAYAKADKTFGVDAGAASPTICLTSLAIPTQSEHLAYAQSAFEWEAEVPRKIPESELKAAEAELNKVRKEWLKRPGVTAVDVGYRIKSGELTDELAVRVHVRRKLPLEALSQEETFPERLGEFAVDVIEAEYGPQTAE